MILILNQATDVMKIVYLKITMYVSMGQEWRFLWGVLITNFLCLPSSLSVEMEL